jgi:hypothetical protein
MGHQGNPSFPSIDGDATSLFDVPNETGTPERRLLLAVLERAILDYVGNDEKEIAEADDWIFDSDPINKSVFSFGWLCQELDLDEEVIAEKIRSMPRRGNRRVAPWYFAKELVHAA